MTKVNIINKISKFKAECRCERCSNTYITHFYEARKSPVGNLCSECKTFIVKMELTQDNLQKAFDYNTDTGEITHRFTTISGNQGEVATFAHSGGYLNMNIGKKQYLAHRIIFLYMENAIPDQVDHINHNRSDNRWINLRDATHMQNCKNHSKSKKNTSSVNGVAIHKPTNKYRAYIGKNYKQIHLGLFDTIEEAEDARKKADENHAYHINHGV